MEKNLYMFHGVGYSVYFGSQEVRMEVERNRELNYEKSKEVLSSFNRKHL